MIQIGADLCLSVAGKIMSTYTRLYSDAQGESHFDNVEIDLASTDYAPPAPPLELSAVKPASQFGFMNAPAGWASDWHPSPARNMFFVLPGEWELSASHGETRKLLAGSAVTAGRTASQGPSSQVWHGHWLSV